MATLARPTSATRLKEELEATKLRTDILFVKLTFIAQIVNTLGLGVLGALVFLYFQRPQIEQMEINRLATERQQVSSLALSALGLENQQDKTSMLNAVQAMYPQYEFLGLLARSQIALSEAAAPPHQPQVAQSPQAIAQPESSTSNQPDEANRLRQRKAELDALETHLRAIEERCLKARTDILNLKHTLNELEVTANREAMGAGTTGKQGRGPAYLAVVKQTRMVQAQLNETTNESTRFCQERDDISARIRDIQREIDELIKRGRRP